MKYFFGKVLKSINKILEKYLRDSPVFREVAFLKSVNKIIEKQL